MTHTPPAIPIAIRPNEVDNNEVEVEWRQAADQNCFLLTVFNAPLVLLLLQLLRLDLDLDLDLTKILKIFYFCHHHEHERGILYIYIL